MLLCSIWLGRHVTEGLLRGVDPSQAVQYSTMEKATATEALKSQEEPKHTQGHAQQNLTAVTSESQVSSVKSEVVPFSTMTVHHVQSSPVVIHQSQHSSALVNHAQGSPAAPSHSEGLPVSGHFSATPPAPPQEPAIGSQPTQGMPSPQVSVNGNTMQSLFIEEIHSASTRNRAVSIEVRCLLLTQLLSFCVWAPSLAPETEGGIFKCIMRIYMLNLELHHALLDTLWFSMQQYNM